MPSIVTINEHWRRWVKTSVWKSFIEDAGLSGSGYRQIIDGQTETPPDPDTDLGKLEFRIDGPTTKALSTSFIGLDYSVNIHGHVYHRDGDLVQVDKIMGLVEKWLGQDFCINRLGEDTGGVDDGSLVGRLELQVQGRLDGVQGHYLGKEDKENISQFSVEAPFRMVLEDGD